MAAADQHAGRPVWLPDDDAVFVPATVISSETDGGGLLVRLEGGEEKSIQDTSTLCPANPADAQSSDDMTSLRHINEATLLHNLELRHAEAQPYTFMSSVLLAVNPMRRLPEAQPMEAFRGGALRAPHPYCIAETAFLQMSMRGSGAGPRNQSVVISGESGAGKTESSKIVLRYLCARSASAAKSDDGAAIATDSGTDDESRLDRRLLQSNPILEAFGNAKTLRNHNSSRFGKFMKLQFADGERGAAPTLCGGMIESYLLERSRLVQRTSGERNFHVFYQLHHACGGDAALSDELALAADGAHYALLRGGEGEGEGEGKDVGAVVSVPQIDDAADHAALMKALGVVGLDEGKARSVLQLLAALMHLGNVQFEEEEREEGDAAVPNASDGSVQALAQVARLLSVGEDALQSTLVTRTTRVAGESITSVRGAAEAARVRDTVAKECYGRIFDGVLAQINADLGRGSDALPFIGVLDIFGFEVFDTNGFEQLLINYTNEVLQATFNEQVFIAEVEMFRSEGIRVGAPSWPDNRECVELIGGRPHGVLAVLDAEARTPKPSDGKFNKTLHSKQGHNPFFPKPKRLHIDTTFIVRHFAGEVTYTIGTFLQKNNNTLPNDIGELFARSRLTELPAAAATASVDSEAASGGGTPAPCKRVSPSVANVFSRQMQNLVATLDSTRCAFVRCIKPNAALDVAAGVDRSYSARQLRCQGVLQTCEVLRVGLPSRVLYADIAAQFRAELPAEVQATFSEEKCSARDLTTAVLWALEVPIDSYRCGLTRIFFKVGQLAHLDRVLQIDWATKGEWVAGRMRRFVQRRRWRAAYAKVAADNAWRALLSRIKHRRAAAATLLQKRVRAAAARRLVVVLRETRRRELEEHARSAAGEARRLLVAAVCNEEAAGTTARVAAAAARHGSDEEVRARAEAAEETRQQREAARRAAAAEEEKRRQAEAEIAQKEAEARAAAEAEERARRAAEAEAQAKAEAEAKAQAEVAARKLAEAETARAEAERAAGDARRAEEEERQKQREREQQASEQTQRALEATNKAAESASAAENARARAELEQKQLTGLSSTADASGASKANEALPKLDVSATESEEPDPFANPFAKAPTAQSDGVQLEALTKLVEEGNPFAAQLASTGPLARRIIDGIHHTGSKRTSFTALAHRTGILADTPAATAHDTETAAKRAVPKRTSLTDMMKEWAELDSDGLVSDGAVNDGAGAGAATTNAAGARQQHMRRASLNVSGRGDVDAPVTQRAKNMLKLNQMLGMELVNEEEAAQLNRQIMQQPEDAPFPPEVNGRELPVDGMDAMLAHAAQRASIDADVVAADAEAESQRFVVHHIRCMLCGTVNSTSNGRMCINCGAPMWQTDGADDEDDDAGVDSDELVSDDEATAGALLDAVEDAEKHVDARQWIQKHVAAAAASVKFFDRTGDIGFPFEGGTAVFVMSGSQQHFDHTQLKESTEYTTRCRWVSGCAGQEAGKPHEWKVHSRLSELRTMHKALKGAIAQALLQSGLKLKMPDFPQRMILGNKAKRVDTRLRNLQRYMLQVMQLLSQLATVQVKMYSTKADQPTMQTLCNKHNIGPLDEFLHLSESIAFARQKLFEARELQAQRLREAAAANAAAGGSAKPPKTPEQLEWERLRREGRQQLDATALDGAEQAVIQLQRLLQNCQGDVRTDMHVQHLLRVVLALLPKLQQTATMGPFSDMDLLPRAMQCLEDLAGAIAFYNDAAVASATVYG